MLAAIRRILYWVFDKLVGAGVKRAHYIEIKFILDQSKTPTAKKLKATHLEKMLQHTIKNVPFYEYLNLSASLQDFPVVNKNIIRKNFTAFQATNYIKKEKKSVSTSGSTGTPFKIYQDKNKQQRTIADNLVFWEQAGYKLGQHIYYFRFWEAFQKKGLVQCFLQNISPVEVMQLTDEYIEQLLNEIERSTQPINWLGYTSAFDRICEYLNNNKPNYKSKPLNSVIGISEKLNEDTKASMHKYFGREALSRYSNVENGILAQQHKGESYFVVNEASYFVEILAIEEDRVVPHNTLGRIVITDLFNYCIPMLRYDTGDLGISDEIDGRLVLTQVLGRKIDVLSNTKGERITFNIVLIVNKYPLIKQCQLIQKEAKKYVVMLISEADFNREAELLKEFKTYLGSDAEMEVEYVNDIPLLASGKRRVMVNEMENKIRF
jgi:phenylacetate-CoA ligase